MRIVANRTGFYKVSMSTENIIHVHYIIKSKRTSIALLQHYSVFASSPWLANYYYHYYYYNNYFYHYINYYYNCFCCCYYYYCCCRWLCLLLLLLLIIIIITLKYMKPIKVICKKEAKMLINLHIRAVWSVFTMHSFCRFCCALTHWPCNSCLIKYICTCDNI